MRQIDVSTEVFSLIWSQRLPGEETEDAVLRRVLRLNAPKEGTVTGDIAARKTAQVDRAFGVSRDSPWWQVIEAAMRRIGGEGTLSAIYRSVREICEETGKRMPPSLEAAIRGTLEDNSSDSDRWKRVRDVFAMPQGKHVGYWSLKHPR